MPKPKEILHSTDVFEISGTQPIAYDNPTDPFDKLKGTLFHLLVVKPGGEASQQRSDQAQFTADVDRTSMITIDDKPLYVAETYQKMKKRINEFRIGIGEHSDKQHSTKPSLSVSDENLIIQQETELHKKMTADLEKDLSDYKQKAVEDYTTTNDSTNPIYTLHQGNFAASIDLVAKNYTFYGAKPEHFSYYDQSSKIEHGRMGLKVYERHSQSAYMMTEATNDPTNSKMWVINQQGIVEDISQNPRPTKELVKKGYKPIFTITSIAELDLTNANSPIATFRVEVESHDKNLKYAGPAPDKEPVVKKLDNIPSSQKTMLQLKNVFSFGKKQKDDGASSPEKGTLNSKTSPVSPRSETNNTNAAASSSSTTSSPVILSRSPSAEKDDSDSESDDFIFLGNHSDEGSPKSDKKGKTKKK